MDLNGLVFVITGGASGLGAGTAQMAIDAGAKVAILDLPTSGGEAFATSLGDGALFVPIDLRDSEAVSYSIDQVASHFGNIHVVVNCAGVPDSARVLTRDGTMFPMDTFKRVVDINLIGSFDTIRNAMRHIRNNEPNSDGERGVIINVSSIAGIEGQAGQAAYAGSKAGIIGMTLPLARDLASMGVRVCTICPGIFDTAMLASASDDLKKKLIDIHVFPKRLGTSDDFARLVRAIIEIPMLNGETIRLDAATRLANQ